jgi:hypothetical protein
VARYEIRESDTGALLSYHRTRQGALDRWRTDHHGQPVKIWRTDRTGAERLIVEGVWHGLEVDED